MSERKLNERQEKLIEFLFNDELRKEYSIQRYAVEVLGYSPGSNISAYISKSLAQDVINYAAKVLAMKSADAVRAYGKVIDEPTLPGATNLINVASQILDRAGVVKQDKMDITVDVRNPVLLLPAKNSD